MRHHEVLVIGTGSGNTILDERFAGRDVAIVEQRDFGGTCVNKGCIPTKMLAYTAEIAEHVRRASSYGVDATVERVRWPDIRDRVFSRLDAFSASGRAHRLEQADVTMHLGHAEFTGPRTVRVERTDGTGVDELSADRIVIATGGRPSVPPAVASSSVPYHTSDTIIRIDRLPGRLAVLGGGYIAAEFAHVFGGLGSAVTIIDVADRLLPAMDETISARFTEMARERFDVRVGRGVTEVTGDDDGVRLVLDDGSSVQADTLLVATGRIPNGDRMNLAAGGIDVHDDGRIVVDEHLRTTAEGVFALGDVSSAQQLKHVANHEAAVVAHNLAHPDRMRRVDLRLVPAAVFGSPPIGTVGRTEQQCRDEGLDYRVAVQPYSEVAYGWAMEDTTGFCKLIAEPGTGVLLGAHLMGAQAPTLVQLLVAAMETGLAVSEIADAQYWIHPALSEVVENALRRFELER